MTEPSAQDKVAQEMIVYAPRRVTLAPRQPQSIRMPLARPRASPTANIESICCSAPFRRQSRSAAPGEGQGPRFPLTPVYGVTIPVIVRLGNLEAKAGIANVQCHRRTARRRSRSISAGRDRSTFGEVRVLKAGVKDPIAIQKAVAVYTEARPQGDDPARTRISRATPAGRSRSNMSKPTTMARTIIAETQAVLR